MASEICRRISGGNDNRTNSRLFCCKPFSRKSFPMPADQNEFNSSAENRNERFEQALTFQQRTLDEFHEVLIQQRAELDAVRRELAQLRNEMQRLNDLTDGGLPPNEKPPHY